MTGVDRRSVLQALVAAPAAAMLGPAARVLQLQDPQPTGAGAKSREQQLRDALATAKEQGKPVLVLAVEPTAWMDQSVPVRRLGEWLIDGGEHARAELATVVLAVASLREVETVVGRTLRTGGTLLLVDPLAREPARTAAVVEGAGPRLASTARATDAPELGAATAALGAALASGGLPVDVLAQRVRDRLPAADRERLDAWVQGRAPAPADALLLRAAACVRCVAATRDPEPRAAMLAALDAALRRQLIARRHAGTQWAVTSGCAYSVDPTDADEPTHMMECGRGRVDATEKRFLILYSTL